MLVVGAAARVTERTNELTGGGGDLAAKCLDMSRLSGTPLAVAQSIALGKSYRQGISQHGVL